MQNNGFWPPKWPQNDPEYKIRVKQLKKKKKKKKKTNSILVLHITKCTFCESFSQIHWKMAEICYFEDKKSTFEKNAFKVTEKYTRL